MMLVPLQAFSSSKCEVVGKGPAATVLFVYCPENLRAEEVVKEAKTLANENFNSRANQIHYFIFNNKMKTPRNAREFEKMSEKEINKYQVASGGLNKNTNYRSYWCKKSKELIDCMDLYNK